MPRVTVVIPTLRRAELVCRAVRSALAQTMSALEVVVVIDGDDPATVGALSTIQDDRLRWISHARTQGGGAARNTGVDAAAGEWVAFLDDDDEWLPTKLERQLAVVPSDGKAVLSALSQVVSSYGTYIWPALPYDGRVPVDEWMFDRHSWTRGGDSFIQCSSLMVPRSLLERVRFNPAAQHEDWEFVIRAVKQEGYPLVTALEPLVVYHVPEQRPSLSLAATWRESLAWAQGLGPLLSKRAFSGFCLTVAAQMASHRGTREAFGPLLRSALRNGAPTAKQLFAFLYFWASPTRLRLRLRAAMQAQRSAS